MYENVKITGSAFKQWIYSDTSFNRKENFWQKQIIRVLFYASNFVFGR